MAADGSAGLKLKIPNFEFEAYVNESNFSQEEERQHLSIEKYGQDDGLHNIPSSESTASHLTSAEQKIFDHCQNRLNWLGKETSRALNYVQDFLQQMYMELVDPDFDKIRRNSRLKIEEIKHLARDKLVDVRTDERQRYRDLAHFKRSRGIQRPAEYPESKWLSVGILISAIVAETIANAYFFADASRFGLLGGAWQAALISIVNVSLSFVCGYFAYRGLYYRTPVKRLFAITGVVFHVLATIIINLSAAHYRDLIASNPAAEITQTIGKLRAELFSLDSLDAVLLFIVGVTVSILAVWKGFRQDDRYPGYGAVDRRYILARDFYRQTRDDVVRDASSSFSGAFDDIDQMISERSDKVNKVNEAFSALVTIHGIFAAAYSQLNDVLKSLLVIYRQENVAVRSDPAPSYFQSYFPTLDSSFPLPTPEDHKQKVEELNALSKRWKESASEIKDELQIAITDLRREMDTLVQDAEAQAMDRMKNDEIDLQRMGDGGYILEKNRRTEDS